MSIEVQTDELANNCSRTWSTDYLSCTYNPNHQFVPPRCWNSSGGMFYQRTRLSCLGVITGTLRKIITRDADTDQAKSEVIAIKYFNRRSTTVLQFILYAVRLVMGPKIINIVTP